MMIAGLLKISEDEIGKVKTYKNTVNLDIIDLNKMTNLNHNFEFSTAEIITFQGAFRSTSGLTIFAIDKERNHTLVYLDKTKENLHTNILMRNVQYDDESIYWISGRSILKSNYNEFITNVKYNMTLQYSTVYQDNHQIEKYLLGPDFFFIIDKSNKTHFKILNDNNSLSTRVIEVVLYAIIIFLLFAKILYNKLNASK